TSDPNHLHISRRLVPMEGRIAIVTNAGRDAVDAGCALDEGADCGRRSRVVLTPRRWRQASQKFLRGDGDNKARSPGSAKETVKTIVQGWPGVPVTCGDALACFLHFARGAAGALGTRHSPRPLWAERWSTT